MAQYQEVFQGKRQRFLIRSAVGADAPALVRYMSLVNRETTFLSMEPGEFERIFPVEREAQLLEEWAASHYHLSLLALTEDGEIAGSCNCAYSTEKQRYRHRASLGLSVRQDFWRQGLGRRLLEVQQAWCRSQGSAWRWTPSTPLLWGCISGLALRWRAPSGGRSGWRTAPIGTCTSWGSFWTRVPLSPDNEPLSLLRHSHNPQKLPSQALVLGYGEAVLLSAYVKDFSAKGGSC